MGGAYVKVSTNDGDTFEFMDDSPLKTFEEIRQKGKTSPVTLLAYTPGAGMLTFFLSIFSLSELVFVSLAVFDNVLHERTISIDSDNTIEFFLSRYTLTPVT